MVRSHVQLGIFLYAFLFMVPLDATAEDEADHPSATLGPRWAIAIHGGAGSSVSHLTSEEQAIYRKSLSDALRLGQNALERGDTGLQVVEQVIRMLEDDPKFNAGRGSVLNSEGAHELDAALMDGRTLACGAVASVRTVRHPITLARLVMTETPHVLLAADGAERFANATEVERVKPDFFRTELRVRLWHAARATAATNTLPYDSHMGTVGCVVLDRFGNLAAGTSTGGLTNKRYGRVGDSPLIGAGTYADNETCAVSCTGKGEQFIRFAVAKEVSSLVGHAKRPLDDAVRHVLEDQLQPGDGGIIAVDRRGNLSLRFSTIGMYRGASDWQGRFEVSLEN